MIRLQDVSVIFNKNTAVQRDALSNVSLQAPEGQFVTVIGSNGAGKSTLLNVLAGELRPDTGRVYVDDRDVTDRLLPERAALVARVFQDPRTGACENLSIEENLALALKRGRTRAFGAAVTRTRQEEFGRLVKGLGLGLEDRLSDPVSLLSGGQRQALSLLMATLQSARILLLDEHVSALDPRTASHVLELTRRIVSEHKLTTLMVTHSMAAALDFGERTIMLHEGRIVLDVEGESRNGLKVPDLVRMFRTVRGEEIVEDELLLG
jgi:putative tryptophan/tyrosine transport system ATP-binding protein